VEHAVIVPKRPILALVASLALHALPALPRVWGPSADTPEVPPTPPEEDPAPGVATTAPRPEDVVPASLFHLSLHVPPPPPPPPRARPVPVPVPVAEVTVPDEPPPAPPPEEIAVAAEAPPEPPPPPPEPPPVEPEAVADVAHEAVPQADEPGDVPVEDDAGEAFEAHRRRRARDGTGRRGRPADAPCPGPHPSVEQLDPAAWRVQRALVDFYASNLRELAKVGTVWTHRGRDGRPDGFRVALSRCSILRQAGLKSGDIVHDVNGRRISTLLQAVAAYFVLRDDPEIVLHVSRRGEALVLRYTLDKGDRRLSRKERKAAAAAAGALLFRTRGKAPAKAPAP
jgi:hypothetical protein